MAGAAHGGYEQGFESGVCVCVCESTFIPSSLATKLSHGNAAGLHFQMHAQC